MGISDNLLNEQNSKAIVLFNHPEQQDKFWRRCILLSKWILLSWTWSRDYMHCHMFYKYFHCLFNLPSWLRYSFISNI